MLSCRRWEYRAGRKRRDGICSLRTGREVWWWGLSMRKRLLLLGRKLQERGSQAICIHNCWLRRVRRRASLAWREIWEFLRFRLLQAEELRNIRLWKEPQWRSSWKFSRQTKTDLHIFTSYLGYLTVWSTFAASSTSVFLTISAIHPACGKDLWNTLIHIYSRIICRICSLCTRSQRSFTPKSNISDICGSWGCAFMIIPQLWRRRVLCGRSRGRGGNARSHKCYMVLSL